MIFLDRKELSNALVRWGVALVFLWFGTQHYIATDKWTGLIPEFLTGIMSANVWVLFKGTVDILFGILLLLGVFTRVSALVLSIDLFLTTLVMGYSPTGVRDFGLTLAAISVYLNGIDKFCLRKGKKKEVNLVTNS